MRNAASIVVLATLTLYAGHGVGRDLKSRAITDAESVLAVYVEDWSLSSTGKPSLIAAIWSDGHAVWSRDRIRGGSPFFKAVLPHDVVLATLNRLKRDGVFNQPDLGRPRFGPEATFTTILVRFEGAELRLRSWHEPAESQGKIVATEAGLEPLANLPRLRRLRDQPAEYLFYRFAWNELKRSILDLIPSAGDLVEGDAILSHGTLTWGERPLPPKSRGGGHAEAMN